MSKTSFSNTDFCPFSISSASPMIMDFQRRGASRVTWRRLSSGEVPSYHVFHPTVTRAENQQLIEDNKFLCNGCTYYIQWNVRESDSHVFFCLSSFPFLFVVFAFPQSALPPSTGVFNSFLILTAIRVAGRLKHEFLCVMKQC